MGMFGSIQSWARKLGIARVDAAHNSPTKQRRSRQFEPVEPRLLLAGTPVFNPLAVGATYLEGDTGTDVVGDTFEITFNGGGPNSQLARVIISGDKNFDYQQFLQNPTALPLSNLDVFFDTIDQGQAGDNLGKDHGVPLAVDSARSSGVDGYTASVIDGTSLLVIEFQGFDAGDKFVFTI
ncbi:MAG: LEPR-XLL domain-containing protein, partial [Planctomycetales bacterium]|nr:LEPR-XLL domain-containing protein [Planctomycetales bacterium]